MDVFRTGALRIPYREAENELLAASERAINRNEATFAALPIHLLLGAEGVIARLRASGYAIQEPELLSR
jgi:hypothetical protein